MHVTKKILIVLTLCLAFGVASGVAAPAAAGPQNGEVNHAKEKVEYRTGKAPESFWSLLFPYVDLLIEMMPLELLFPDAGDPCE
jgi:hypothetical protein